MVDKTDKTDKTSDSTAMGDALNISMLKDMVNHLEETKAKLNLNIKELNYKLAKQIEDQADIYFYLNKKCDESFEVISRLEEQIISEQADREVSEKTYETKIEEIKLNSTLTEAKLNAKIIDLENKLEALTRFSETKDDFDRDFEHLLSTLEAERAQFNESTETLENNYHLERERMRKNYEHKFEEVKKEMDDEIESKISKKTKKTQLINSYMKKDIEKQSKHAEKLLEINQTIIDKDKTLKLELSLSQALQQEMMNRLNTYRKTMQQLELKLKNEIENNNLNELKNVEKLEKKDQEIFFLETKLNRIIKKYSSDNNKLDDMWYFLSNSLKLLRNKNKFKKNVNFYATSNKSDDQSEDLQQNLSTTQQTEQSNNEFLLLIELIKELLRKYPNLLSVVTTHNTKKHSKKITSITTTMTTTTTTHT